MFTGYYTSVQCVVTLIIKNMTSLHFFILLHKISPKSETLCSNILSLNESKQTTFNFFFPTLLCAFCGFKSPKQLDISICLRSRPVDPNVVCHSQLVSGHVEMT